jgi:outer membrane protein OmpA-like peptidoglycan-associated protein
LTPTDLKDLRVLGEFLAWAHKGKVRIDGYCDIRGTEKYNQALSDRRAATVREFLLYHGAKNSVVEMKGHGFESPVAPNDTEENMAKNRRSEIKVEGI